MQISALSPNRVANRTSLYALVHNERYRHIREHELPMGLLTTEMIEFFIVPHGKLVLVEFILAYVHRKCKPH